MEWWTYFCKLRVGTGNERPFFLRSANGDLGILVCGEWFSINSLHGIWFALSKIWEFVSSFSLTYGIFSLPLISARR